MCLTCWWRRLGLWWGPGNWWLFSTVQQIRLLNVLLAQAIPLTKVSAAVRADNSSHSRTVSKSRGRVMHNAVVIVRNVLTVNAIGIVLMKVVRHT